MRVQHESSGLSKVSRDHLNQWRVILTFKQTDKAFQSKWLKWFNNWDTNYKNNQHKIVKAMWHSTVTKNGLFSKTDKQEFHENTTKIYQNNYRNIFECPPHKSYGNS